MKNYHNFVDYIVNLASEYKGSSKRAEIEQYALKQADDSPYHVFYDEAWELVGMVRFENYDLFEECDKATASNGRTYCSTDDLIVGLAKEIIRSSIFQAITSNLTNPIQ